MGRGEYVLSDDPRDFEQFGTTMEYRGRPFLVVDNVPKLRGPHLGDVQAAEAAPHMAELPACARRD